MTDCNWCDGSGGGIDPATRCPRCKGSGMVPGQNEDDEEQDMSYISKSQVSHFQGGQPIKTEASLYGDSHQGAVLKLDLPAVFLMLHCDSIEDIVTLGTLIRRAGLKLMEGLPAEVRKQITLKESDFDPTAFVREMVEGGVQED